MGKNTIMVVISFMFLFLFSGCGELEHILNNSDNNTHTGNESKPTPPIEPPVIEKPDSNNPLPQELQVKIKYKAEHLKVTFNVEYNNAYGEIEKYHWIFGDNTYSNISSPEHIYDEYKTYNVTLDITYKNGKTSSLSENITLEKPLKPYNLFLNDFGSNDNFMYFAIHIKGSSKTGKFMQENKSNMGQGEGDFYARDIKFIFGGSEYDSEDLIAFSDNVENYKIESIYSKKYGFTDKNGLYLDIPFYIGHPKFYIPMQQRKISFRSFSIIDKTKPIWGGYSYPLFIRCSTSGGVQILNFEIPYDEYSKYQPNIHDNIALFTIDFNGDLLCYESGAYKVTFDGFVIK